MKRLPLLFLFFATTAFAASPEFDLVIRGGRIVDGTGSPWYRADVAIKGDHIAAIAPRIEGKGAREIDARGLVVSPGFIDLHTHARRGFSPSPPQTTTSARW